jgi:hypothetical protein
MALIVYPPLLRKKTSEIARDYGALLEAGTHYLMVDGQIAHSVADIAADAGAVTDAMEDLRLVGCMERGAESFDLNDPFRHSQIMTFREAKAMWARALEDGAALFTFTFSGRLSEDRLRNNSRACPRERIRLAAGYGRLDDPPFRRQARFICARPRRAPIADWIELLGFCAAEAEKFLRASYAVVGRAPFDALVLHGELVRRDGQVDLVSNRAGLRALRRLGAEEERKYYDAAAHKK